MRCQTRGPAGRAAAQNFFDFNVFFRDVVYFLIIFFQNLDIITFQKLVQNQLNRSNLIKLHAFKREFSRVDQQKIYLTYTKLRNTISNHTLIIVSNDVLFIYHIVAYLTAPRLSYRIVTYRSSHCFVLYSYRNISNYTHYF